MVFGSSAGISGLPSGVSKGLFAGSSLAVDSGTAVGVGACQFPVADILPAGSALSLYYAAYAVPTLLSDALVLLADIGQFFEQCADMGIMYDIIAQLLDGTLLFDPDPSLLAALVDTVALNSEYLVLPHVNGLDGAFADERGSLIWTSATALLAVVAAVCLVAGALGQLVKSRMKQLAIHYLYGANSADVFVRLFAFTGIAIDIPAAPIMAIWLTFRHPTFVASRWLAPWFLLVICAIELALIVKSMSALKPNAYLLSLSEEPLA